MPFIEQLGQQAATQATSGIIGAGMGLLLEKHNDKRQKRQQEELQRLQIAGSKELTDYNAMKQLQMWKDTNYSAQMEQLQKAGLNPGLIYGMGGGGGQGTNLATGNVASGNAPQGGGEIQGLTGMGIQTAAQLQLLKAQKENIEADTANKQAENPNIPKQGGKIEAETQNIKAQETLTRVDTELRQVQASVARQTIMDQMHSIENAAIKGAEEIRQLRLENELNDNTLNDKIATYRANAIGAAIENILKNSNIQKKAAEINKIANDISLGWETLANEQKKTRIQQFTAEFQAGHPGIMNVLGGAIQRIADGISKPLQSQKVPNK